MMKSNQNILRNIYQKEPSKIVERPDGKTETIQIPLPEEQTKVIDRMEALIHAVRQNGELSTDTIVLAATMVEYINSKIAKLQTKIADLIESQLETATAPAEAPKVEEPKDVEEKTAEAETPKGGKKKG